MTTGAMVLGAVPLALATGAGAESRQQIGWVIVGGMSLGTLLTMFVVPTMYTLFARDKVPGANKAQTRASAVPPRPRLTGEVATASLAVGARSRPRTSSRRPSSPAATLPCSWCSTTRPLAWLMLRRMPEPWLPVMRTCQAAVGCGA